MGIFKTFKAGWRNMEGMERLGCVIMVCFLALVLFLVGFGILCWALW